MLAVHIKNQNVTLVERPRPRRPRKHALIRLISAGICNTDLELFRGYYSFEGIPGHEFVGRVVASDTKKLVGRRVVGEINLQCNRCSWCHRGLGRHCPNRRVLGIIGQPGVFQEFFTLPERNLHTVPDSIPDDQAVFTEPIAAACEIVDQIDFPEKSTVAVLGDGKLGLLCAQVLKSKGLRVHLFGRHENKLDIARKYGISAGKFIKTKHPSQYDWVVEATGSAQGIRHAMQMSRPRGTVILKSTLHGHTSVDIAALIVNEISLVGSRCGRFEPALKLLETGKVRVQEMITTRVPLSEAPQGFKIAAKKGSVKILLDLE